MHLNPLHLPLDRPPQAISLTVRSLLQRVQKGGVRIPSFQRPLRWKATNVQSLFDSLWRGYPIGSLLFWSRPAPADPQARLGGASLPLPEDPTAWWIVDGQQRVTALAACLLDLDHGPDPRWQHHFDPREATRGFHAGAVPPHELGRLVPLKVLGDLRRLGRWMRESSLGEDELNVVEQAQQRILDYELSAYLMETDQPEALRGVFARLNSTGVRMRSDEVFQALLGGDGDRASRDAMDLNALQAACDFDGFGQPPRSEVMKAVLAMSGQDPTKRPEALGEKALQTLVPFDEAEQALERAVAFLQAAPDGPAPGVGIPCYAFLPYPVVFTLLARWFHKHPDPTDNLRRALSRWVWRGVFTGAHQRAEVSKLRDQLRLIEGADEQSDLLALQSAVSAPSHIDWSLQSFHARNARSRVELLALLSLGPRHPDGPVSWRALVSDGQRVAREIVRSDKLKSLPDETRALARSSANRALLDTNHTGLETELLRWDAVRDQDALASHLLDGELLDLLRADDVSVFLERRAQRVSALVSRFLSDRTGAGLPTLRPTTAYHDPEGGWFDDDSVEAP